jgi:tRNA-modifying protein YgfZ
MVDAGAYEATRIAGGVLVMGHEITDRTIPAETQLIDLAVSFTKGCYTGQELVARVDSRGGNVPRMVRAVRVDGDAVPPPGAVVVVEGADAGQVTSAAWSAERGQVVALASVRRDAVPPLAAAVTWDGGEAMATVAVEAHLR